MVDEVSLRAFVDSTWFRGLFRGAVLVLTGVSGYIAFTLSDVRSQQVKVASDLVEVQRLQSDRAEDGEDFQGEMRTKVVVLTQAFSTLDNKVDSISEDVATIKGLLLRREDTLASR
jgi:hypothetical protein